jgi:hypothetical protein
MFFTPLPRRLCSGGETRYDGGPGKISFAEFTGISHIAIEQTRRKAMLRTSMTATVSAAVLMFSTAAFGQQSGTAAEAKAMLMKAAAAVKADKTKALDMFNKGEGGFLDRDLYVFCDNVSDGKTVAVGNPNAKQLLGTDGRTLKDAAGKPFGEEIYAAIQKPEGEITEISYVFPRPGADKTPVPKVSLVTKIGDIGCGVGYYKQ